MTTPRFNIYKYELDLKRWHSELTLPVGTKFISAHNQHGKLMLWAQVPENAPRSAAFNVFVLTTGSGLAELDIETYVGTVLFDDGYYVVHVYAGEKR